MPGRRVGVGLTGLADLGYEGDVFTIPLEKPKGADLTVDQQTFNAVHGALRCPGERANSLLKTTYKALRRYRGCPWRIGIVVADSRFSTARTTAPRDQQRLITQRDDRLRGQAQCPAA